MKSNIHTYFNRTTSAAPLAIFRIGFGVMMLYSIIRFAAHGWINTLYIEPQFHFSYFGFTWVQPVGNATYLIFALCGLAALFVALGYKYRISMLVFFLSFTYIELMDKTTYLNHYYFISALSFLLLFLPAARYFSIDTLDNTVAKDENKQTPQIPKWTIDSIKLLLGVVYFYAGLAKLNSDWLIKAMPLKIWLPSKYDIPLLGNLMEQEWVHYAFSWSGMLYDLFIPFLLLYKRTRILAFVAVVVFHVLTRVLFPIGMFPFVMIVSALIFFDSGLHERIINYIRRLLLPLKMFFIPLSRKRVPKKAMELKYKRFILPILGIFFALQLLLPWRYLAYPGELFWTEEGYRFSWRVMLMEKMGSAQFKIVDEDGKSFYVQNSDFLTPFQEKQMSYQPDFILQYAHFLGDHFTQQGHKNVAVYVDSYVALNGRLSQPYVDKAVNLYAIKESFQHKSWILPFNDEIKGL
ncbi:HTTM domain-containing protein [Nonlabens sp.]|uniref:HTTM domain-containing protein n=1 Tax=Nonlabens sp. TaxID=1888209 RepID=UPI003266F9C6